MIRIFQSRQGHKFIRILMLFLPTGTTYKYRYGYWFYILMKKIKEFWYPSISFIPNFSSMDYWWQVGA